MRPNPWLMLVAGFIVGGFLAWFWLRRRQSQCEEQVASLQRDLAADRSELQRARQKATALESTLSTKQVEPPAQVAAPARFGQTTQSPEELADTAIALEYEGGETQDESNGFSGEISQRAAHVTDVAASEWVEDDLTLLEGIGPKYAAQLRSEGITTFADLAQADEARLASIIQAPAWRKTNYGDWIAQARLAAAGDEEGLAALQAELFSRKGDNLTLIYGLGDKYAKALQEAGITSYADLAAATPDQVEAISDKAGLRGANFEGWIAEAGLRAAGKRVTHPKRTRQAQGARSTSACPQDLAQVDGIGQIYEQRLYAYGIGTFWELANTDTDDLARILAVEDFQAVDLARIRADAARLAEESNSVGRAWDGSKPDDLESIEGIGEVFERRLYEAGICTFAALASASEETLAAICRAPAWSKPDYAAWIQQASARAAG